MQCFSCNKTQQDRKQKDFLTHFYEHIIIPAMFREIK